MVVPKIKVSAWVQFNVPKEVWEGLPKKLLALLKKNKLDETDPPIVLIPWPASVIPPVGADIGFGDVGVPFAESKVTELWYRKDLPNEVTIMIITEEPPEQELPMTMKVFREAARIGARLIEGATFSSLIDQLPPRDQIP